MDESNIAGLRLNHKTGDQMPAGMSVVTFPALANLDRGFDLQPDRPAAFLRGRIDQVGISLVGIVFEWRMIVERVAQHIGDESTEIVTLNVFWQWLRAARDQDRV